MNILNFSLHPKVRDCKHQNEPLRSHGCPFWDIRILLS
jgi:hypothetical protein